MKIYLAINLKNFDMSVYITLTSLAEAVGVHKNSLINMSADKILSEKKRDIAYLIKTFEIDAIKRPGAGFASVKGGDY